MLTNRASSSWCSLFQRLLSKQQTTLPLPWLLPVTDVGCPMPALCSASPHHRAQAHVCSKQGKPHSHVQALHASLAGCMML